MIPTLRISLHDGGSATVHALNGAEEAELGTAEDLASEPWVSRALVAAATVDGEPPGLDGVRALTVGDRNAVLLAVIVASYGAAISWVIDCPACGEALDADVNLSDLLQHHDEQVSQASNKSGVPTFRLPSGADLEDIAQFTDPAAARIALLRRCVEDTDALSPDAVAVIEQAMAAADPLADIALASCCTACGTDVSVPLDPVSELASRLAAPAELLADVHALALSYGWTEPDVLALPRPHRREYLALCADVP